GREAHLAAGSSVGYLLWLLTELFVFVAVGSTALIARFTGAGDRAAAVRAVHQSFLLGAIGAVIATAGCLTFGERLVQLVGLHGESADLALDFLGWVFPVLPCIMVEAVAVASLRGVGDVRGGLWIMALVNFVNVAFSWALMFGIGPLPALGWEGVAAGTALGHVAGAALAISFFVRGRDGLRFSRPLFRPDFDLCRRILRIGIPGGLDMLAVILCQIWFLSIVNGLGDLAGAAHGVAIRVESLAFTPGTAFQVAATTMVGLYLGAGDPRGAIRAVQLACLLAGAVICLASVGFYFFGAEIASLWVSPDKVGVIEQSADLLKIVAFGAPALTFIMILTAALRGAGDTRWPLAINLFGFLTIRIPLAYLLAYSFGLGVVGAWYAMVIDLNVRCVLNIWRFWNGGWKTVEV
ncbi:MAG TPA: MATE family efflux transporter, partial [Pirellulales bacterium]